MNTVQLLKKLTSAVGVSGAENSVCSVLRDILSDSTMLNVNLDKVFIFYLMRILMKSG